MALPIEYDLVEVRGRYVFLTGQPVPGQMRFSGKVTALSPSTKTVIIPAMITVPLDAQGQFSVMLPATDDPDIVPGGWTYTVEEAFPGGRKYEIDVPISAKNSGIDLSLVAPVDEADGDPTAFVTLTTFQASLGSAVADAADALETAQAAVSAVAAAEAAAEAAETAAETASTTATIARGGIFNVVAYGGNGNGSALNDTAIANALAAIPSQGGVLYFPRGIYNISTPLPARSNLVIRGEGRSVTRIVQTDPAMDGIANTGNGLQYLTIEDLDVRCTSATGVGVGINIGNNLAASSYLAMHRVNVQGFGGTGVYLGRWIASTVNDVRSQGHGGHAFHLDKGTSYTLTGCYALNCQQSGYRITGSPFNYTALIGAATDSCGIGYDLENVQGVTLVGCGNESGVNRSANYPGTGVKITGGSAIGIYNHFAYDNVGTGIHLTGSAISITVIGYRDNTPRSGGTATSIKTDSGVRAVILDPRIDGVTDYAAGTVVTLNNGARSELTASGNASVLRATTNTVGATNTQPIFQAYGSDAANRAYGAQLAADSSARWMVDVAGRIEWGSGSAARDVALYRKAADQLGTDDAVFLANQAAEPATPTAGGILFVQAGALKFKGSGGTVTTIGAS